MRPSARDAATLASALVGCGVVVGCGANHQTGPTDATATDGQHIQNDTAHTPADAFEAAGPYGSNGSASFSMVTATVTAPSSFTVDIYLPSTSGPHPVVVLSSGLEQPAAAYATYGERLASWGIIAILRDDPGVLTATSTIVDDVAYTVTTWLPSENTTSSSQLFGLVDTAKIGLAGHSRGGQVSLLAAEGSASGKVVGMFGLDPVDGASLAGSDHHDRLDRDPARLHRRDH